MKKYFKSLNKNKYQILIKYFQIKSKIGTLSAI